MGENTFVTKSDGQVIPASCVNQYATALNENLVPRNSSGVPTDQAGDLGTTTYGFDNAYVEECHLGNTANGVSVTQNASNELSMKVGGAERTKITLDGLDAAGLKDSTISTSKIIDSAVTSSKINDAAVTEAKIQSSAVTTNKINDTAVTTDKIAVNAVTSNKIGPSAVDTTQIAIEAVTTSRLDGRCVTKEKREIDTSFTSSSGSFTHSTSTYTTITNHSISMTLTFARPLRFEVLPNYSLSSTEIYATTNGTGTTDQAFIGLFRDSTQIDEFVHNFRGSGTQYFYIPSIVFVTGNESGGTYSIRVKTSSAGGTPSTVTWYWINTRLVATYI